MEPQTVRPMEADAQRTKIEFAGNRSNCQPLTGFRGVR